MITIRQARPADAAAVAAVHVAAWRSAYPGILPERFLAGLSVPRQANYYDLAIRGGGVHVATVAVGATSRVIGFATSGARRDVVRKDPFDDAGPGPLRDTGPLADGEIETLYVLDDWRDQGAGRRLMRAAATRLAGAGCSSAFLWVLRDNPSRWFYERLGGRAASTGMVRVGGQDVAQTAYVWSPIERLVQATSPA